MAEKHLNTVGTHVWLYNPETGGRWECPVGVADAFVEQRGWEFCEPPAETFEGLYDADDPRTGVTETPAPQAKAKSRRPRKSATSKPGD